MATDADTVKAVSPPQVVRESRRDEFPDSTGSFSVWLASRYCSSCQRTSRCPAGLWLARIPFR